ncbi:regulator of chromosome condensation 1/beta-lactamase-inhibitor protein II [Gloeopeniophorella convolvens]|nr:regulator of chromosome condensation 1/beta-lactamase-inhibitor protein II [Gloeopeniophorella convolvens]
MASVEAAVGAQLSLVLSMHFPDIPVEILLHHLLTFSLERDILSLGCTSKFFARLCADETLWKRRCEENFARFMGNAALQRVGWKKLFIALSFPRIFVWGWFVHRRRGMGISRHSRGVRSSFPVEVKLPGVRVVRLVAGPWSFSALDSEGSMFVWGALDGDWPLTAQPMVGFDLPLSRVMVESPHRLILPNPVRDISYGPLHCTVLDSRGQIWTFTNWFRPFRIESAQLDCHSPETTPTRVACGSHFSAALTQSGDVFVFFPFNIDREERHLTAHGTYTSPSPDIQCITRTLQAEPHKLPSISQLDSNNNNELSGGQNRVFLVKIAALSRQVIGLTNGGHLLMTDGILGDEANLTEIADMQWEHLDMFCEPQDDVSSPQRADSSIPRAPALLPISEIATELGGVIVAYSPGADSVLMGSSSDRSSAIVPGLQGRSVSSVALGNVCGALGHGTPAERERPHFPRRSVEVPTRVSFDHGTDAHMRHGPETFCIDVAVGDAHTGALVVNLENDA